MRYFHVFTNEDGTKSIRGEVPADIDPRTVATLPAAVQEFVEWIDGGYPGETEPVRLLVDHSSCRNEGPNDSIIADYEILGVPGGADALARWDDRTSGTDNTVEIITERVMWFLGERARRKGFDLAKGRAAEMLDDGHSLEERCEFLNEQNLRETCG